MGKQIRLTFWWSLLHFLWSRSWLCPQNSNNLSSELDFCPSERELKLCKKPKGNLRNTHMIYAFTNIRSIKNPIIFQLAKSYLYILLKNFRFILSIFLSKHEWKSKTEFLIILCKHKERKWWLMKINFDMSSHYWRQPH